MTITTIKKTAGGKTTMATNSLLIAYQTHSLIQAHGRTLWTTSHLLAEKFGKLHDKILQAVANLDCSAEFHPLDFEDVNYTDELGKSRKIYDTSRDEFSLLGMDFNGQSAAKPKEQFIAAIGKMKCELLRLVHRKNDPALKIASNEKNAAALLITDCLGEALPEAGKICSPRHFITEHSLCKWLLTCNVGPLNQNDLDCLGMRRLKTVRRRNSMSIIKMQENASRKAKFREELPLEVIRYLADAI